MKSFRSLLIFGLVLAMGATARAEEYGSTTYYYTIDVGNGDVVLIVGNENAVYVPAPEDVQCDPVRATMLPDGSTVVVMPTTELAVGSAVVKFKRVVLLIDSTGQCRVVEAFQ